MEMSPEMTAVDILDYTLTNHINFEAEIRFAEDAAWCKWRRLASH